MSDKSVFVAEIDAHELALRIMIRALGMRPSAKNTKSAAELLSDAEADWPDEAGKFPFYDMAQIAIKYFGECISKGQRPS